MVLFVFTIMLLNAGRESPRGQSFMVQLLGTPVLLGLLLVLAVLARHMVPPEATVSFGAFRGGTAQAVGKALFTTYLLPFEATSILILIAIIGAVVLARKEVD
jgi:NADH-quinone oxidoreductase subunit J